MGEKMLKNSLRRRKYLVLWLIDLLVIISSVYMAMLLRFDFVISKVYLESLEVMLPIILIVTLIFLKIFKVNKSLWEFVSVDEALRLGTALVLSGIVLLVIKQFLFKINFPRSVLFIATIMEIAFMLGMRIIYRYLRMQTRQKNRNTNAFIIGAGDAGNLLYREIKNNPQYDCKVIGFIDDNPTLKGRMVNGVEILGGIDDFEDLAEKYQVKKVYLAIPSASKDDKRKIIEEIKKTNVTFKMMAIGDASLDRKTEVRDVSINDLLGRGQINLDNENIKDYLKNKVIMVTGGGGSIGSELCRQIIKFSPAKIIIFDMYENNMYEIQQEINMKKRSGLIDTNIEVDCIIGSVRDRKRLDTVMQEYHPDVLFHAAAHKHVPLVEDSPKEAIKNNVFGTNNTLQACIANKVGKFILISTDKAVNPTNVMGATKRMCELIIQANRNNGVTKIGGVRFGNVLGSHGSVIPLFKQQIAAGGPVTVTHRDIIRYFIFVLDMGEPVKILKLAEDLITLSGLKPYKDIKIEFTGLRPGEKMYEELSLGNEKRFKTANDLIFVNEPLNISLEDIEYRLKKLHDLIETKSDDIVRKEMLEIVK